LVVDEGWVYFTSEEDGVVWRVDKHGGPVSALARGQHDQEHLALDGTHLYWATRTPAGVHALMRARVGTAANAAPEQVYVGLRSAGGLAVDDHFVYIADRGAGEIVRIVKDSG
jgi:hypothetical protein